jgi:predicted RND superfamily exporter protein
MSGETKMDRRITAYARWIIRWRWPVLAAVTALALLAASGIGRLAFATNYRVFFGEGNPELAAFEAVQNIYTKNDSILFVVAPDDGQVFSNRTLAAIEELTSGAWQIPASIRVDSITNFQYSRGLVDDLIVEDLVEGALDLNPEEIAEVREVALERPELRSRLIAESADVAGVNVTLQLKGEDPSELNATVAEARRLAAEIEGRYPGIEVRLTGVSMLNNAFVEAGMGDMQKLIPIMYLVLIVTMVLMLRSFSGTVATVGVIGLSSAVGLGLAGWRGVLLEPVSAQAATMILTMAIADSIHILVTLFDEMRRGKEKREALVEALRINFVPVALTSLTTAIGFLSMNFSDSPPLNRLGNITATGVTAAFLLSVSLLPALMAVLPVRVRLRSRPSRLRFFARLGDFVVGQRRALLWGMTAVTVVMLVFIPANEVSDRFVRYFDESIEFRRDTDFATERLTGIYQLQFSLASGEPGGISNPSYLAKLEEFSEWFRAQPDVVHVSTLSDTMKRLSMNMHGDDPDYYRLPEDRDLAAQYLLLYEMSLPYGLDLNNQINVDKSSTRLIATVDDIPTKDFLDLADRAEEWLRQNAPAAMVVSATGPAVMFSHITERNIHSMILGTAIAFLLISGVLVLALKSWKLGLLSLVPNLVPALMAFGAWGLLVGEIGFAVSVVAAMTMGIVVDDSVHFLSKYLRAARERGFAAADAVRYAFNSVGRALWVTSAVLVAGFLILAQSTFKQNSDLGLLAAVTILFALAADFLLLPALLIWIDRKRVTSRDRVPDELAALPLEEAA